MSEGGCEMCGTSVGAKRPIDGSRTETAYGQISQPWEGKPRRRQEQIWQTLFAPSWPYYLTLSCMSITIMSIDQLDFFKDDFGVFLLVFHSVKFSRQRKNWHFSALMKKWRGWYGISWISLNMTHRSGCGGIHQQCRRSNPIKSNNAQLPTK